MSDLSELKMPALRALAKQLGIKIPVGTTRMQAVEMLSADVPSAELAPAAKPKASKPKKADTPDGYRDIRKPITEVNERGDWVDPHSGLRVHHSARVCVQSGAQRDGDVAVLRVKVAE